MKAHLQSVMITVAFTDICFQIEYKFFETGNYLEFYSNCLPLNYSFLTVPESVSHDMVLHV